MVSASDEAAHFRASAVSPPAPPFMRRHANGLWDLADPRPLAEREFKTRDSSDPEREMRVRAVLSLKKMERHKG